MALKTAHITRLPNLDHVSSNVSTFNTFHQNHHHDDENNSDDNVKKPNGEFMVIGHRGTGMNLLQSNEPRMKVVKENSILAFNTAGKYNLDYIEFDVQVLFLLFKIFKV